MAYQPPHYRIIPTSYLFCRVFSKEDSLTLYVTMRPELFGEVCFPFRFVLWCPLVFVSKLLAAFGAGSCDFQWYFQHFWAQASDFPWYLCNICDAMCSHICDALCCTQLSYYAYNNTIAQCSEELWHTHSSSTLMWYHALTRLQCALLFQTSCLRVDKHTRAVQRRTVTYTFFFNTHAMPCAYALAMHSAVPS